MTKLKFRFFLLYKIPIAFIAGLRLVSIDGNSAKIKVKYSWWNQNPFNSMYFAVQAMGTEITTGLLVFQKIEESGLDVSMLVVNQKAIFNKKAVGLINFECNDGNKIAEVLLDAKNTGEGKIVWLKSIGTDESGSEVCSFLFKWSVKVR